MIVQTETAVDAPAELRFIRVLLAVAGDATNLDTLGDETVHVSVCKSVGAACEALREQPFDAVVLDLDVADADGLGALERTREVRPEAAIVTLAGAGNDQTGTEALRRGAQDLLLKAEVDNAALRRSIRFAIQRQRLLLALETRIAELRRSNNELQEFALIASHDLQAPLRKIQVFAKLLRDEAADRLTGRALDYLQRMTSAAQRMSQLVDALLSYSRIHTRGGELRTVDLMPIVFELLKDMEPAIRECDARIRATPLPVVEADPTQMRQLFGNLVGNALKFRRAGVAPQILIDCQRETAFVSIRIRDNGVGFPQEDAEKIFRLFYRAHGESEYEGCGIGLGICRRIVERHGGTIAATSAPGQGAEFVVRLPLRPRPHRD